MAKYKKANLETIDIDFLISELLENGDYPALRLPTNEGYSYIGIYQTILVNFFWIENNNNNTLHIKCLNPLGGDEESKRKHMQELYDYFTKYYITSDDKKVDTTLSNNYNDITIWFYWKVDE